MKFIFFFIWIHFSLLCIEPEKFTAKIIAIYPHETSAFTQGLIYDNQIIYESCGLYGQSCVKKYELKTGKLLQNIPLPPHIFGEGIAIFNDRLIQLSWKENMALVYDLKDLSINKEINYKGEGWGLCTEENAIWMSDGSSYLYKRDPHTFEVLKKISVNLDSKPQGYLNDLVCVNNHLYANVLNSDNIFQIDKDSGQITAIIDASHLLSPQQKKMLQRDAVLNGITYKADTNSFLLTGKFWPHIFEVVFRKND